MRYRIFQHSISLSYLLIVMVLSPFVLLLNYGINPGLSGQWDSSVYLGMLCTAEGLFLILVVYGISKRIEFSNNGVRLYSFNKLQKEVLWGDIKSIHIDIKHIVKQYVFEDVTGNVVSCELTKKSMSKVIPC